MNNNRHYNADLTSVFFRVSRPICCVYCAEPHDALCDFPSGDGGTCDKPICRKHSVKGDTDTQDFCSCHIKHNEVDQTNLPDSIRS